MKENYPKFYATKNNDDEIRLQSRSGGVFSVFSDYVLKKEGVIYGCALNDNLVAEHIRASNDKERDRMRGSKYVQSDVNNVFAKVKSDLENEKIVLFTGTACQVAGLKSFLNRDYKNLVCIDVLCHGVPSPLIFKEYLKWQEIRNKGKCKSVEFRNKRDFGWREHVETIYIENKDEGKVINSKIYTSLFYSGVIMRPSCYNCQYKSIIRSADLTMADCWGIEKAAPEMDDDFGVSLVIINNDKGEKLYNSIEKELKSKPVKIEDCLQEPLIRPYAKPATREKFWEEYRKKGFDYIVHKYTDVGVKNKLLGYVYKIYKKVKKK